MLFHPDEFENVSFEFSCGHKQPVLGSRSVGTESLEQPRTEIQNYRWKRENTIFKFFDLVSTGLKENFTE